MKSYPDQFFKNNIGDRIYIDNRKNTTWVTSPSFIQAIHSEQLLYIIDRNLNEKEEPVYTLSFFPIIEEHDYDTNLKFILKEIMCAKDKKTGKIKVSDYFSAFQRTEIFLLTNVPESAIIASY